MQDNQGKGHGYWCTIPSFNPTIFNSEPGQDLEGEAIWLLTNEPAPKEGDFGPDKLVEEVEDDPNANVEEEEGFKLRLFVKTPVKVQIFSLIFIQVTNKCCF